MLKFGREGDGSMGKTKGKNVVYVGVFRVFWATFLYRPIRFVDLIEINNKNLTLFNRFCVWPAQFLRGPLLNYLIF